MQVISQYCLENDTKNFDLMNIVGQFLSPAVLSGASKILLVPTNDKGEIQRQVVTPILPKFVTHIHAGSTELQFCLLKHWVVLARRFPTVFKSQLPHFCVNFSDGPTVPRAKFELLQITTDGTFAREVIETTARPVLREKPFTIQMGIKLIRDHDAFNSRYFCEVIILHLTSVVFPDQVTWCKQRVSLHMGNIRPQKSKRPVQCINDSKFKRTPHPP
jgi:hypothetical protein